MGFVSLKFVSTLNNGQNNLYLINNTPFENLNHIHQNHVALLFNGHWFRCKLSNRFYGVEFIGHQRSRREAVKEKQRENEITWTRELLRQ
jgi:hypothetical protein